MGLSGGDPNLLWEKPGQALHAGRSTASVGAGSRTGGTLGDSDSVYRSIFEAAPDGVVVVDGDGVIVEANPALETLFGYDEEELVGSPVEILVPDGARALHAGHRSRYTQEPHPRPMGVGLHLRGRRKDGVEVPVEISLSPLPRDGRPWVIASVRDITERQRLRDFGAGALRASEEERQRIARELHDDTAQRLAALLVRLRLLERFGGESEWREAVGNVREELKACAEGVRRIARGLRPPELEDAGVVVALRSHLRTLGSGVDMAVDLDAEPVDSLLSLDGKLVLYRVIQEAVSNAVRHSRGTRVEIRLKAGESRIEAVVEDDGVGFLPDAVQRNDQGSLEGLGLVGMEERAVMVGGHVDIDSRPGEGTRVTVILPIQQAEEVQRV